MAYRETPRAQAAVIRRRYRCNDCQYEFSCTHATMDEPVPDCPACHVKATWDVPIPGVLTNKSRAIDFTQQMAEQDFGMTNIRDNQRAGDIAYMGPPAETTAEREKIQAEMMQFAQQADHVPPEVVAAAGGFWSAGGSGVPGVPSTMDQAASASAQAKREGSDVVGLLEQGRERGISTNVRYDVVGRAEMPTAPAA